MLHVFIDTNIYLSFYHYTNDDLNKLEALGEFRKSKKITLYVNGHLQDEYYRNRHGKIKETIDLFKLPRLTVPRLFDQYGERKTFLEQSTALRKLHKSMLRAALEDTATESFTADNLIGSLMGEHSEIDSGVYLAAQTRINLGNPPGKNGSIGDAIHWEYLLANVPSGEDLTIVTDDRDWKSALNNKEPNELLQKEWARKKGGKLSVYRSLVDFFAAEFPEIKLEGEYKKELLIDELSSVRSFDSARDVIARLMRYDGSYTPEQLGKLIVGSLSNDQVYNAHKYSPEIVGGRLHQLIDGKDVNVDQDTVSKFQAVFEMPDDDFDFSEVPF